MKRFVLGRDVIFHCCFLLRQEAILVNQRNVTLTGAGATLWSPCNDLSKFGFGPASVHLRFEPKRMLRWRRISEPSTRFW